MEIEWNDVEKVGLPKKTGIYLVTCKNGFVVQDFFHNEKWTDCKYLDDYGVIAWAELPEPYRKGVIK